MTKLAAPYVGRGSRAGARSAFNEGISVPAEAWAKEVSANPALASSNRKERSEAITKETLTGSLAKYRRR